MCVNVRPISILFTFSEVFEKAVTFRLNYFLETFSILSNNRYGFKEKRSTLHVMFQLVTKVAMAVDNYDKSIGIFLDLHKALDYDDHNKYCLIN